MPQRPTDPPPPARPDRGWVLTITLGPHPSDSSGITTVKLSESRRARLREFGVAHVVITYADTTVVTVFLDEDAAGPTEVEPALALAREALQRIASWLNWTAPLRSVAPVHALWCDDTTTA